MQTFNPQKLRRFRRNLLRWFEKNQRTFPWRETRNPYRVIVGEFLLQKTNVEKVLPVYREFIKQYPTVDTLAGAMLDDLVEYIRPLGLLYRALRMKRMAQSVVTLHGGKFPREKKELCHLYGVGDYMTNAVRAFAYSERVPIVDTNVIRVFDRVFGLKSERSRARTDRLLWEQIGEAVPRKHSREFNLALLDFAALVCTARKPKCARCPMKNFCLFYASTSSADSPLGK